MQSFLAGGSVLPAVLALAPAVAAQNTWYVAPNPGGPGTGTQADPYASIQSAIDAPTTVSGDSIYVQAGVTYFENVSLNSKVLHLYAWNLGSGLDLPTIDGGGLGTCLAMNFNEYGASVSGFRLRNGHSSVGGGLYFSTCAATISGCIIEDNVAEDFGGGVAILVSAYVTFDRCVIANNHVVKLTGRGGGMWTQNEVPITLDHCVIWGNRAPEGAGIAWRGNGLELSNTVVWNNSSGSILHWGSGDASTIVVEYCDVEGGFAGTGNIASDPLFWNPWAGNFLLTQGSPCIDAGDPASPLDPGGSRTDIGVAFFVQGNQNGPRSFCSTAGDDPSVTTACPCGNAGAAGHGCAHSASGFGAVLTAAGSTSPDAAVLHAYGMPATASAIYFKGDALETGGAVFGDGVRCAGGTLIRIGMKPSTDGASQYPVAGDDPLSVRGSTPPGSGLTAYYQTYFRNAASFCTPATFNATNGYALTW